MLTAMDLAAADWERLGELRESFLASDAGARSATATGWSSRRDLEIYDATFAQRIGWKWRAVLREIELRGALPAAGVLLDWGCGTGIASRAWLAMFGGDSVTRVEIFDQSNAAQEFAAEKLREEHPAIDVRTAAPQPAAAPDVLLLSHVLGELDDFDIGPLLALARASGFVVWVEPGNHATSRRLSAVHDQLRGEGGELEVVAPCTHQASCGMLAPGQERNWCHHFATPPPEAFTSRHWALFSKRLGIDLRALPYSFLVLRRGAPRASDPALGRVLGRPRLGKGHALVDLCTAAGVRQLRLLERTAPEIVRRWKKGADELPLYRCHVEGERISAIEAAESGGD